MESLSFEQLFLETCTILKVHPCEKVLKKIEENTSCLNLSGVQLSNEICEVLGQAFVKDVLVKELDCSNCLISEEGVSSILQGLEKNKFLLTMNLKGNNLRSHGGESIGKFLRHNNHIQNLYLEWNSLGVFPEKFSVLCEGLCVNTSLRNLDLRNNQLNHVCAQSISEVILRNMTLQKLDLRWNSIGLIGGRILLKALLHNKSLVSLDVSGNEIHVDILEGIEIAVRASAERHVTHHEHVSRSQYLAEKLEEMEEERNLQMTSLLGELEKKDTHLSLHERLNAKKMAEVSEVIAEKNKLNENLSVKLQRTEKELWSKSEENSSLAFRVSELAMKNRKLQEDYDLFFQNEQEEKVKFQKEMLENNRTLKEENSCLKLQNQDLQLSLKRSLEDTVRMKNNAKKIENELRVREELHKEKIWKLEEDHSKALESERAQHKSEVLKKQEELHQLKEIFEKKITFLESRRNELEKELQEKKTEILMVKAHSDEMMVNLEKKLKSDHEMIKLRLEERIDLLEDANKEQSDHLQSNLQVIYQLKTDITSLDLETAEQFHEIQKLRQNLQEKDDEMKAHEAKVKLEIKEQLDDLQKSKERLKELERNKETFQEKLEETERKQWTEMENKNACIKSLRDEVKKRDQRIQEILENEKSRSLQLKKALEDCMASKEDPL